MNKKLYPCQIPGCTKSATIRSTIKTGEHKGKKACGYCKQKYDGRSIKHSSEKAKTKRKEDRKGLPSFFSKATQEVKANPICQNCGCKIRWWSHPVNNVAHLLSKSRYKSVMSNENNYVILCSEKDLGNGCHELFDTKISERPNMKVFPVALEKYKKFREEVLENGKEKIIFEEKL